MDRQCPLFHLSRPSSLCSMSSIHLLWILLHLINFHSSSKLPILNLNVLEEEVNSRVRKVWRIENSNHREWIVTLTTAPIATTHTPNFPPYVVQQYNVRRRRRSSVIWLEFLEHSIHHWEDMSEIGARNYKPPTFPSPLASGFLNPPFPDIVKSSIASSCEFMCTAWSLSVVQ